MSSSSGAEPELLGRLPTFGRDLYLARPRHLTDWPVELGEPRPHFIVLLVMDARATTEDEIAEVGRKLLAQGMVYVCAWGPDCERVHGVFDLIDTETGFTDDAFLMSTGHSGEGLDDALWFSLFATQPADAFVDTCRAVVAIVVDQDDWAEEIATALSDVDTFNRAVLAREAE